MDHWFLCKDLFRWLEARCFDWVMKAKSNTALYQLTGCDYRGIPRYRSVTARMLLIEQYNLFVGKKNDRLAIPIPDIYMKMPVTRPGRYGRLVCKQELVPIATVAICQLPEDVEQPSTLKGNGEKSLFRGTHLIISNRVDAPGAAVNAYTKRWRIEVFYRAAKQELGLNTCRSETEHAHFAHIEMIFVAETLLRLVMHEYQDSSGQRDGDEVVLTHGQVIQDLSSPACSSNSLHPLPKDESILSLAQPSLCFQGSYYPSGRSSLNCHLGMDGINYRQMYKSCPKKRISQYQPPSH